MTQSELAKAGKVTHFILVGDTSHSPLPLVPQKLYEPSLQVPSYKAMALFPSSSAIVSTFNIQQTSSAFALLFSKSAS